MRDTKKRQFKPKLETKVRREDFQRVEDLARMEKKTKSEVVREAVLWYLDNQERLKNEPRETAIALEIEGMTNRICAMLASVQRVGPQPAPARRGQPSPRVAEAVGGV